MHLVHWNTAYGNFDTAKSKRDGLAVLAILFEANHPSPLFKPLSDVSLIYCMQTCKKAVKFS